MKLTNVLVTGGAGFVGSHFISSILEAGALNVLNVDRLTYSADLRRLSHLEDDDRYNFAPIDIASESEVRTVMERFDPDLVVHFAAESHVARSKDGSDDFFRTNDVGSRILLNEAARVGVGLFVHLSTYMVYGPRAKGAFGENDKLPGDAQATNPYARSKALVDDAALATKDLPVIVARPTTSFGPLQLPEKALSRWITQAFTGRKLTVVGEGATVRQWLSVRDLVSALLVVIEKGTPGQAYNVGPTADGEVTNLAMVHLVSDSLGLDAGRIEFVGTEDPRDLRYAVDPTKIIQLGWRPHKLATELTDTIEWYRNNEPWWRPHLSGVTAGI